MKKVIPSMSRSNQIRYSTIKKLYSKRSIMITTNGRLQMQPNLHLIGFRRSLEITLRYVFNYHHTQIVEAKMITMQNSVKREHSRQYCIQQTLEYLSIDCKHKAMVSRNQLSMIVNVNPVQKCNIKSIVELHLRYFVSLSN